MMRARQNPAGVLQTLCGFVLLASVVFFSATPTRAVPRDTPPEVVEVYWHESKNISVPGVTQVLVLEDTICKAEQSPDSVHLVGLTRGETVVFLWDDKKRMNILVRVVEAPRIAIAPHLSQAAVEALGHGFVGSNAQSSTSSAGDSTFFLQHHFSFQQEIEGRRFTIRGQAQDAVGVGARRFDLNTATVQYSTPDSSYTFLDFILNPNGGLKSRIVPLSTYNSIVIRGIDVTRRRNANLYEAYAGATLPSYFLSLSGSRDVFGFNWERQQTEKLFLFSNTGVVNAPFILPGRTIRRATSFFATGGLAYRLNRHWALQGAGGVSTRGTLLQGAVSYAGERLTAYANATSTSENFPLNQLQLFFAGGSSVGAAATYRLSSRMATSIFYQHSSSKPTSIFLQQGTSDYVNPNFSFALTPREAITVNYSFTNNRGGLISARNQGRRLDLVLNSQLPARITNTAQFTLGSLNDPLQLNAHAQYSMRDSLNVPVKGGNLLFGFGHNRTDPSLVARLNQVINLLSPDLQRLFLLNPLGFVQANNLPPEIRALLENLQPSDTEFSVTGQFRAGRKLSLSPNFSYQHNAQSAGSSSHNSLLGYSLTYLLSPSLQLQSSLSNGLFYNANNKGFARTTVLTFGIDRSFTGTPRWLVPSIRGYSIEGRVFRDMNVNGVYNAGEPGLAGVKVLLDKGQTAAVTDAQGVFRFSRLRPGNYQISLPLEQFHSPVRVTTPTEIPIEVADQKVTNQDFGIVNFARLMGTVFNDYEQDDVRQADAPGMRAVELTVAGKGWTRNVSTDNGGDFEIGDISPGDYEITVDSATLPASYIAGTQAIQVSVQPTATVVQDIPVRALRSISGTLYLKVSPNLAGQKNGSLRAPRMTPGGMGIGETGRHSGKGQKAEPKAAFFPLAGIQISAANSVAVTDAAGTFVLRNLPAGDLTVALIPTSIVPADITLPSGRVRMPREPLQVEGGTIVITNPTLLKYLRPAKNVPTTLKAEPGATPKHSVREASREHSLPAAAESAPLATSSPAESALRTGVAAPVAAAAKPPMNAAPTAETVATQRASSPPAPLEPLTLEPLTDESVLGLKFIKSAIPVSHLPEPGGALKIGSGQMPVPVHEGEIVESEHR